MQVEHGSTEPFFSGQKEAGNKNDLDFLSGVFYNDRPDYFEQLAEEFANFPKTDIGIKSRQALTSLLTTRATASYKRDLDLLRLNPEEQERVFNAPQVVNIAKIIATDAERFKFQLGVLLPILADLGINIQDKTEGARRDNSQLRVTTDNSDWWLCDKAEERMYQSLENNSAMVINGFLAFKLEGRRTALATENVVTESGHTFVRGNFYAPSQHDTRKLLENKFLKGQSQVDLQTGDWVIIRAVSRGSDYPEKWLMGIAGNYVQDPPVTLADHIDGLSRKAFLQKRQEQYPT